MLLALRCAYATIFFFFFKWINSFTSLWCLAIFQLYRNGHEKFIHKTKKHGRHWSVAYMAMVFLTLKWLKVMHWTWFNFVSYVLSSFHPQTWLRILYIFEIHFIYLMELKFQIQSKWIQILRGFFLLETIYFQFMAFDGKLYIKRIFFVQFLQQRHHWKWHTDLTWLAQCPGGD